jgi:hypothetical protein
MRPLPSCRRTSIRQVASSAACQCPESEIRAATIRDQLPGVSPVSEDDRRGGPVASRRPPGLGQLRHAQTARIQRWLAARPRFFIHFTPTSAFWLNLVERSFAVLTQKQIKRGAHRSTRELERAIREYVRITNEAPTPFIWTKTADQILASVARYCERISDLGH